MARQCSKTRLGQCSSSSSISHSGLAGFTSLPTRLDQDLTTVRLEPLTCSYIPSAFVGSGMEANHDAALEHKSTEYSTVVLGTRPNSGPTCPKRQPLTAYSTLQEQDAERPATHRRGIAQEHGRPVHTAVRARRAPAVKPPGRDRLASRVLPCGAGCGTAGVPSCSGKLAMDIESACSYSYQRSAQINSDQIRSTTCSYARMCLGQLLMIHTKYLHYSQGGLAARLLTTRVP